MAWTWRYQTTSGEQLAAPSGAGQSFPTQSDAESWVGEAWPELLESGVDAVVLLEDGREVYGPMSLHEA